MVATRKFSTVTMNFLMVGHTHEDVDQLFGLVTGLVVRETPQEFQRLVMAEMQSHIEETGESIFVEAVDSIRNFNQGLSKQAITLQSYWATEAGIEASHSFTFKRRSDLNHQERSEVPGPSSSLGSEVRMLQTTMFAAAAGSCLACQPLR